MTETMTETLPACDIPFEPFPVEDSALETIVSAIVEKKLSEGLASDVKKSVMLYTRNVVTATANAFRDNVELGLKRLSALEKQTKELRALTGKKRKQSGLVEQLRRKNGTLQAEVARLKKKAEMRSLQIKVLKDGKKKRKVLQEPPPPKTTPFELPERLLFFLLHKTTRFRKDTKHRFSTLYPFKEGDGIKECCESSGIRFEEHPNGFLSCVLPTKWKKNANFTAYIVSLRRGHSTKS